MGIKELIFNNLPEGFDLYRVIHHDKKPIMIAGRFWQFIVV